MTAPQLSLHALTKKGRGRRCPACGHRLQAADVARCPLCEFQFGRHGATGGDVTPFATAFEHGRAGWREMCEWVWFAGTERLKHLALMRASAASRRFARNNLLLLSLGLGVFQVTQVGWRWVTASAQIELSGQTSPRGFYWLHAAAAPRPLPVDNPPEMSVDLWWNWVQAVIGGVAGVLAAMLVLFTLSALLTRGVAAAHRPPYRAENRMTAAMHYSTAWCLPLTVAALVMALRPISFIGSMSRWSWYPPEQGFVLSAAVVAGLGAVLWWFWLVRLGSTAPGRTRSSVLAFVTVGAPVLVAAGLAVWYFGLRWGLEPVFVLLKLEF